MNLPLQKRLLAATVASTLSATAWALDPMPVRVSEGLALTPTLKLGLGYDDNFRAVESGRDASWVSSIAPTLALGTDTGKVKLELRYTANHELYHSSRKDDNTDHLLGLTADLQFDVRNRLRLAANYRKMEETASADQKVENDKYNSAGFNAGYTYGADNASGQIRLGLNHDRLRYDNGLDPISAKRLNADKERDSTAVTGAFLYRVTAKTRALAEARLTDHDYVSNTALDSRNTALLFGAEWDATAFTSGSARFGRERKDFDRAGKRDTSTGMWEVGITWAPLTYSSFSLNTRRGFDEGSDNADSIKTQSWTLSWKHDWSERLSSNLSYTNSNQDYDRPSNPREDTLDSVGIGLTYKMRRWLDVGVGYKHTENDSTQAGKSYKRNVVGVTVNASL